MILKLPATPEGNPDWKFMEHYIRSLGCQPVETQVPKADISIGTGKWHGFTYDSIFEIRRGQSRPLDAIESGDIPYISSTGENNGISAYVSESNCDGNVITIAVNGSVGSAFYQPWECFVNSDAVALSILPEYNTQLNPYIAMFLLSVIKLEQIKYSYGRKWNACKIRNSIIRLPVTEDGLPDWQYMESFVKHLQFADRI